MEMIRPAEHEYFCHYCNKAFKWGKGCIYFGRMEYNDKEQQAREAKYFCSPECATKYNKKK